MVDFQQKVHSCGRELSLQGGTENGDFRPRRDNNVFSNAYSQLHRPAVAGVEDCLYGFNQHLIRLHRGAGTLLYQMDSGEMSGLG